MDKGKVARRNFAVALFILVILAGYLALHAAQPRIKFREASRDFGKTKAGEVLTHEFVFTNEGDTTLIIKKVTTSCGCTAALVSEDKLAPGKQGQIEVKFDTRGYGGRVSKYIFVDSNDPAQPRVQLEVTADIEVPPSPKIEIDPYNHDAGLILAGEELMAPLRIVNKGELELRVEFNHRNAKFFANDKAAPTPLKVAAGKEANVDIRIPTQERLGTVREYILIKSNDPMRSTLSLYITGYVISKEQLRELFKKYKDILR